LRLNHAKDRSTVAPVNETDTVLLPEGLNASKGVARLADLKIDGSYLNLGGGFDSAHNRKAVFNVGLIPNIKETRATERPRSAGGSGCLTRRRCRVGGQSAGESVFYHWNAEQGFAMSDSKPSISTPALLAQASQD
jgi:hypothetical protein